MNTKVTISLIGLIYIAVGVVVAVQNHYITLGLLKVLGSAVLAIALWWLVLLGIDLHLH
jgi:hypothetical protein